MTAVEVRYYTELLLKIAGIGPLPEKVYGHSGEKS